MSTAHYLGIAEVARALGVQEQTVTMWRHRYDDTPEPTVLVAGKYPGWVSLKPWLRWQEARKAGRPPPAVAGEGRATGAVTGA